MPKPLQQALNVREPEVTQSAIVALPQHTTPEICTLQQADSVILELLKFWKKKQCPNYEERAQLSWSALILLRQWDRLVERDGVLYRQVFRSDGVEPALQLLLPDTLTSEVLNQVHQEHGHQGVERTLVLLRSR